MDKPVVIEEFYGVYLLCSLNDKHSGKTYIGFTVNPNRRIRQHNKGKQFGGARKTSDKGPWKMVLIIHGFPNNISALRFEWAWQNPGKSRRLHHIENKKKIPRKESPLQYSIRILSEMLRVGPWNRLPLTIRWLDTDYYQDFNPNKAPPLHMPICYGPVQSKKVSNSPAKSQPSQNSKAEHSANSNSLVNCHICFGEIETSSKRLTCMNTKCNLSSHVNCLADLFLSGDEFVPVEGNCPKCDQRLLWGNLIRKMKGCDDVKHSGYHDDDQSESDDEGEGLNEDFEYVDSSD